MWALARAGLVGAARWWMQDPWVRTPRAHLPSVDVHPARGGISPQALSPSASVLEQELPVAPWGGDLTEAAWAQLGHAGTNCPQGRLSAKEGWSQRINIQPP